ncbi:MAG: YcaQ family DNA glycosylase [Spirochaetes bacterium]|nr:YcaQ family DNA glycosylase [Spirochaetota bacterium]MBN2772200.1 YcaQ family DNA glycosylase [Spirochaetota bacterium]
MKYTKDNIRKYLINYHNLNERITPSEIVPLLFKKFGCIQYDPLNITGRNADLVLQSRVQNYRPSILDNLLYSERKLIDGWDKMMSIYPVTDWPLFTRMRIHKERETKGALEWRKSLYVLEKIGDVIEHLNKNGESKPADIDLGNLDPGKWGHRRESTAVLDYLFHTGKAAVARKNGTQKSFDLAERLLPAGILKTKDPFPDDAAYHRWLVLRRVSSVGILWNRNSVLWQNIGDDLKNRSYRQKLIDDLIKEKKLTTVNIEDITEPFYIKNCDTKILKSAADISLNGNMRFIAPLDNLIWDRDMIEQLFGFNYRWEVYMPAAKREYGYYVLPILYNDKFAGRLEPVADRKNSTLIIKNFWKEPEVKWTKKMYAAMDRELKNFAGFLGLNYIS